MLITRLWMGTLLIGVAVLLLCEGWWFAPWYPVLFVCYLSGTCLATRELLRLLPVAERPNEPFTLGFIALMACANWSPAFQRTYTMLARLDAWHLIGACLVVGTVAAFLREMARFRGPGRITVRVAL